VPQFAYLEGGAAVKVKTYRPIVFLDLDDVLVVSKQYTSYQVIETFKSGDLDGWPELWAGLIFAAGRANLLVLHEEFCPQYVISSSWSNYLTREQMCEVFHRTGLDFVAANLHEQWNTLKNGESSSRTDEIEAWIERYRKLSQAILVLDDDTSGWGLVDSCLDLQGYVVLCESSFGFVEAKRDEARQRLRIQFPKDILIMRT
jgi:hypothetical protein